MPSDTVTSITQEEMLKIKAFLGEYLINFSSILGESNAILTNELKEVLFTELSTLKIFEKEVLSRVEDRVMKMEDLEKKISSSIYDLIRHVEDKIIHVETVVAEKIVNNASTLNLFVEKANNVITSSENLIKFSLSLMEEAKVSIEASKVAILSATSDAIKEQVAAVTASAQVSAITMTLSEALQNMQAFISIYDDMRAVMLQMTELSVENRKILVESNEIRREVNTRFIDFADRLTDHTVSHKAVDIISTVNNSLDILLKTNHIIPKKKEKNF